MAPYEYFDTKTVVILVLVHFLARPRGGNAGLLPAWENPPGRGVLPLYIATRRLGIPHYHDEAVNNNFFKKPSALSFLSLIKKGSFVKTLDWDQKLSEGRRNHIGERLTAIRSTLLLFDVDDRRKTSHE